MRPAPRFRDDIVFQSALVRIGAFRCDADHAAFHRSAAIVNNCVWFSRTPVIIQPEFDRSFIANATTATLYNRGQFFGRRRVADRGDESDWFAVDESLICRIVAAHSASGGHDRARAFPWSHVAVDSTTYLRQRRLFEAATAVSVDVLAIEEGVIRLVERVIAQAAGANRQRQSPAVSSRHRDLVRDVEVILSGEFTSALSLSELAGRVGTSVYHLCRVFRRLTGSTMHEYRRRLRLRAALGAVMSGDATLTEIAVDLGFPSHSHFTAAFRDEFGVLPSRLRRSLRPLPRPDRPECR